MSGGEKMTLGERIKDLRRQHGLSQEQLADKLNVSRQAVQKWEANVNEPSIDTIKCIACYFNVNYEYLLNGEAPPAKDVQDNSKPKKNFKETISKLSKLSKTFIILVILTIFVTCFLFIYMYAISPYSWDDSQGVIHNGLIAYWMGSDANKAPCVISVLLGVLLVVDIIILIILIVKYFRRKKLNA